MRWPSKRSLLLPVIGARRFGALSYALRPGRRLSWGGPFNGQAHRCLLFASLVQRLRPVAIVETGTYLGTTTEWMAAFQVPVFTCESSEESFGFAQARLSHFRNVAVTLGDSREFLHTLLEGELRESRQEAVIFYLDAHWCAGLPLADEIDIVFRFFPRAAVMIDDFQVPDDPGYGFDSYGPGLALDASYVDAAVQDHRLTIFYPSTPSSVETGMRRGCTVLCKTGTLDDALRAIPLLTRAETDVPAPAIADCHALPHPR